MKQDDLETSITVDNAERGNHSKLKSPIIKEKYTPKFIRAHDSKARYLSSHDPLHDGLKYPPSDDEDENMKIINENDLLIEEVKRMEYLR